MFFAPHERVVRNGLYAGLRRLSRTDYDGQRVHAMRNGRRRILASRNGPYVLQRQRNGRFSQSIGLFLCFYRYQKRLVFQRIPCRGRHPLKNFKPPREALFDTPPDFLQKNTRKHHIFLHFLIFEPNFSNIFFIQELKEQSLKSEATMEAEMRFAQAELLREKREQEDTVERQKKKFKIAELGSSSVDGKSTPRTSTRSRFGL